MRDIFGTPVVGARVNLTQPGGRFGAALVTGLDGMLAIPEHTWEESFLYCSDFHVPVKSIPWAEIYPIPGRSGSFYGELAILPVDWEDLRVSLQGIQAWKQASVTDERLGIRFLYLMPGEYEIADRGGSIHGTAHVSTGQRTTFVVSRWSGLKIDLTFVVEPEGPTSVIPVMLQGVSPGASFFKNKTGFLLSGRTDQRSHTQYGLEPGLYRVYVEHDRYQFSESVQLEAGRVRKLDVRLCPR